MIQLHCMIQTTVKKSCMPLPCAVYVSVMCLILFLWLKWSHEGTCTSPRTFYSLRNENSKVLYLLLYTACCVIKECELLHIVAPFCLDLLTIIHHISYCHSSIWCMITKWPSHSFLFFFSEDLISAIAYKTCAINGPQSTTKPFKIFKFQDLEC